MERAKSVRGIPSNLKNFSNKPSPYDFVEFFPWACKQYEVFATIHPVTTKQFSTARKSKANIERKHKVHSVKSFGTKGKSSSSSSFNFLEDFGHDKGSVEVTAIFDQSQNLISLKIENNAEVPRAIFQVLDLIIDFYPLLTTLSANRGLDPYCIHEIAKILLKSAITEVYLDGTCLKNPNYHILLETASNLNCYSLAKCQINDEIVKKIAETLTLPCPGAKTLTFLNLSSNGITDTGVSHLAEALKTNRHLAYINLADNRITDTGASYLYDIMLGFPILSKDLEQSKLRRKEYTDEKNKLFRKFVEELKTTDETKSMKRKVGRRKSKKGEDWTVDDKVASPKSLAVGKMVPSVDAKFFDKAENLALQAIGPFEDPFENSFVKDDIAYCTGNNTLGCLNFAYNNLSYNSLQKLIEVLNYQKNNQQTPRGLFRVRLEGNYLPSTCKEYSEINELLDSALESMNSKQIKGPKKIALKKIF